MKLFLSRLHFPVTTLGLGRRIGIWFQGCTLQCPGCVSHDTWAHGLGETTVDEVLETLTPWLAEADGVTISGGEPFQQPMALECLLNQLRTKTPDILLYTGYPWKIAEKLVPANHLVDVIISEPYRAEAGHTLAWRGSDNQRMHLLTPYAQEKYEPWVNAPRTLLNQALDVVYQDGTLWMAGIPEPGMLANLTAHLESEGFSSHVSATPTILA